MNIEIRWPTVGLVGLVIAGIVAIFAFAGPDERVLFLSILSVLGTAGAAVMRAAFGVPKDKPPTRLDDDDDSDANGGVVEGGALDDGPPTRPIRTSTRRNTLLSVPIGLSFALLACSPSTLQTHATIASVTGHVFDTACSEVEHARSVEQHAIADGPLDREDAVFAVTAVRARWAPALASCELAADTHDAWVTTLALAAAGAPFTLADGLALAQQALSVWQSLSATLMIAGVEMPAVPPELVALVGGDL